jgi:hypothetical protein
MSDERRLPPLSRKVQERIRQIYAEAALGFGLAVATDRRLIDEKACEYVASRLGIQEANWLAIARHKDLQTVIKIIPGYMQSIVRGRCIAAGIFHRLGSSDAS